MDYQIALARARARRSDLIGNLAWIGDNQAGTADGDVFGSVEVECVLVRQVPRMSNVTFLMVPVNGKGLRSLYERSTTPPLSRPMSMPA